ncbi:type II secretion system secretin GspD [Brevundimonas sp. NPDC092305]|uniref:type II secretion system secretin GspD n=1 Tax=Brevundimonas sp. NPDC092305 TaxID=3363957 RepID=UPI0038144997
MYRQSRNGMICLMALMMAAPPAAGVAQTAPAAVQGEVVVNMRGVDIRDVTEQIARITGRTIVLDPNVSGVVTVVSAEPLSANGVWELYQTVLRTYGFAAVRNGAVWRVVPQATVIQNSASASGDSGQQVITRLIRLRNLPSDQAARALRPLVAQFGSLEAVTNPNAVVVTDYADNVRRIQQVAQALDSGGGEAFESLTLQHASAEEVAEAMRQLFGEEAGGPRVSADPRSNTVLVRGTAEDIAQARSVVSALDQPGGASPITRVVRLRNADAEGVVDIIRGLMGAEPTATNAVSRSLRSGSGLASLSASRRPSPLTPAATNDAAPAPAAAEDRTPRSTGFALDDVTVQSASELNAVVMRGSPATVQMIQDLIVELDVRRPQVVIEAAIVEITGELGERLGVQLAAGGAVPGTGVVGGSSFTQAGTSLGTILQTLGVPGAAALSEGLNLAAGREGEFGVLLQALSSVSSANLLSTPSITVLDNEEAEIVVGQNVPFRTGAFATDGNTVNPFTTISREDVGVTLRVTPRVHDGDVVRLEVSQEVSSLVTTNVSGAADLITNRRSVDTTVLADNGQVITLGGLITDDRQASDGKVPGLGDIPGLGALFRSRRDTQTRRTLFIFLRPTILRSAEDVRLDAQRNYDRLRQQETAAPNPRLDREEVVAPRLQPDVGEVF